jgi:CheY-like chemotaxis protein
MGCFAYSTTPSFSNILLILDNSRANTANLSCMDNPEPERLTILQIEDDYDDTLMYGLSLPQSVSGCAVVLHTVRDSSAAIDHLSPSSCSFNPTMVPHPDIIVLDLRLGYSSGIDFLVWHRNSAAFSRIPLVLLTGASASDPEVARAKRIGVARVYHKQGGLLDLRETITEICTYALGLRNETPTIQPWIIPAP